MDNWTIELRETRGRRSDVPRCGMIDFEMNVAADEKTGHDSAQAVQGRIDAGRRLTCTGHQRLLESQGGRVTDGHFVANFRVCCAESVATAREAVITESAKVAGGPFTTPA